MKKIIWLIISTLTALSAALFLYDGQKLLFSLHDRRQGILLLLSGCCILPFYGYCICHAFPKNEKTIKLLTPTLSAFFSGIFPGFAAAGFSIFCILPFYGYCICHAFPKNEKTIKLLTPTLSAFFSGIFPGFAAAGFSIFIQRYESLWYIAASALASFFLFFFLFFIIQILANRLRHTTKEHTSSSHEI